MKYAGINKNDFAAAPGVSVTFFTQGCPHRCHGCHNPETWDFDGGKEFTPQVLDEIVEALTANGYRVQLYSSNAARKAKETALEWKATFEKDFPQHHAYLQYQAPFWKLRVGDFTHYASAVLFSEQLKKAYPKEADEIIIIKEKQVKPLYFEAKELVAETDSLNTILE